jgi:GT2 family glycosyltransferase
MGGSSVAVIIPAYNGELVLRDCIESLLQQTRRVSRIYVVDNASTDGTEQLIRDCYAHQVKYTRLDENIGPTGGFATGMKLAISDGHDWLWLMDQDAQAEPGSIEKLLQGACTDERILAAAPAKCDSAGCVWVGENHDGIGIPLEQYRATTPFDIDETMWSGLLLRACAIRQAGLPLVQLFGWWCDGEYCCRLRRNGRVVLVPQARICHHRTGAVHMDFSTYWKHYYYQRNSMYLYRRGYMRGPGATRMSLGIAKQVAYIILRQDHKAQRLRILLTAVAHALVGRMGPGPAWLRH